MNKIEQWVLRRIISRECRQDWHNRERIINLYKEIRIACEKEFYDDNTVTMNSNLREWFEKSLRNPTK